jgi:hypothetical protein
MDLYLERHWPDVHQRLCTYACDALNDQLGEGLRARMGERLVVERELDPIRATYPDVRVFEQGPPSRPSVRSSRGITAAEPLVIEIPVDEVRQPFVQIVDLRSGAQVITVIEFLSPSNKLPGQGRSKYQDKQREVVDADINLVEVDLTRGGERQLLYPVANLPTEYQTAYLASVRRGFGSRKYEIYRIPLRELLPAIRIPLREPAADVVLDLQDLITQVYAKGRYDDMDYRQLCVPPSSGEDAAWAEELLTAAGMR